MDGHHPPAVLAFIRATGGYIAPRVSRIGKTQQSDTIPYAAQLQHRCCARERRGPLRTAASSLRGLSTLSFARTIVDGVAGNLAPADTCIGRLNLPIITAVPAQLQPLNQLGLLLSDPDVSGHDADPSPTT